jgi:periplasmic protein TonB
MFRTLLASNAAPVPAARPVLAAGLLHVLIIVAAVRLTASPPLVSLPPPRDTMRLQIYRLNDPEPLRDQRADPSPPPPPEIRIVPELPAMPKIDVPSSPTQPAPGHQVRPELGPRPSSNITSLPAIEPVFEPADGDDFPRVESLRPDYPKGLQRAGISGDVVVEYIVLPTGRADSASVRVIASTDPAFTMSVIKSVLSASFKPAHRSGRTVPVLVRQTIRFRNR